MLPPAITSLSPQPSASAAGGAPPRFVVVLAGLAAEDVRALLLAADFFATSLATAEAFVVPFLAAAAPDNAFPFVAASAFFVTLTASANISFELLGFLFFFSTGAALRCSGSLFWMLGSSPTKRVLWALRANGQSPSSAPGARSQQTQEGKCSVMSGV